MSDLPRFNFPNVILGTRIKEHADSLTESVVSVVIEDNLLGIVTVSINAKGGRK